MLISRGIWFTKMDLWPACYSKRCRRLFLRASFHSVFNFELDWRLSQSKREDSHTLSVFWRAWSNSSPTNPQAVDDHKSNLISCQCKNCFSFLFSLWNESKSRVIPQILPKCWEGRQNSSGCLKASILKNCYIQQFYKDSSSLSCH